MVKKKETVLKKLPGNKKKSPHQRKEVIKGKHKFSKDELQEKGAELADKIVEKYDLNGAKKEIVSDFKKKIQKVDIDIDRLSENVRAGYEYRDHECFIQKDYDKSVKTYTDTKTGEVIDQQPFEAIDYETDIFD